MGSNTSFQHEKWMKDELLAVLYPRIFSLSLQKNSTIHDTHDDCFSYNLILKNNLYDEKLEDWLNIMNSHLAHHRDKWSWKKTKIGQQL